MEATLAQTTFKILSEKCTFSTFSIILITELIVFNISLQLILFKFDEYSSKIFYNLFPDLPNLNYYIENIK